MAYSKILAALDHSALRGDVFDQALALAKLHQGQLMLFHCIPLEQTVLTPYPSIYSEEMANFSRVIHERLQQQTEETQQWLADYGARAEQQGIHAEWDWKIGEPSRHICDLAQTWEADLIVLGRRGLQGLAEIFLGSVSNYVVHHARCSVLLVQHPKP